MSKEFRSEVSRADTAAQYFEQSVNCAQSVLIAYAEDLGLTKDQALSVAVGFGAGMGRAQEVCGAVSGAIMVLGLRSEFKQGDGRDKINSVYAQVRNFLEQFTKQKGTIKCRDLLPGCDLSTEEGQKYFKEHNLRNNCREFVRLACELLDDIATK